MSWNNADYFRGRAATERALAASASHPGVAAVHEELAERYETLVNQGRRPTLQLVTAAKRAAEPFLASLPEPALSRVSGHPE